MRPIIITYTVFDFMTVAYRHVDRQDARNLDIPYWSCPPNPILTSLAFATNLEERRGVGMTPDSMVMP